MVSESSRGVAFASVLLSYVEELWKERLYMMQNIDECPWSYRDGKETFLNCRALKGYFLQSWYLDLRTLYSDNSFGLQNAVAQLRLPLPKCRFPWMCLSVHRDVALLVVALCLCLLLVFSYLDVAFLHPVLQICVCACLSL